LAFVPIFFGLRSSENWFRVSLEKTEKIFLYLIFF
jgi:hypothetical protein